VKTERRRRALRAISTVLIAAGVLILADAVCTLVWQEPLTSYLAHRTQNGLRDDLGRLSDTPPTQLEREHLQELRSAKDRIGFMASEFARGTKNGQAVGRIVIHRIGADFVVVKGSDPADLRKGPGVYDSSPLPGESGTVAIAGHRTTYLAPFRHVDELKPGDFIDIQMPYANFRYRVQDTKIVSPTDVSVVASVGYDRLVLTACHPLFSASHRIVVFSRLVSETPARIVDAVPVSRKA